MAVSLKINNKATSVDVDPEMPLLWALRDVLKMKGTKFGCGMSLCGACTVLLDGEPVRSCVFPISAAEGKSVTTIEGLSPDSRHPVQKAWAELDVPQCGYCQSGMIMAASALLAKNPKPTEQDIEQNITNICRCGTYPRIKAAIQVAAKEMARK